jgi:hypothetical protein
MVGVVGRMVLVKAVEWRVDEVAVEAIIDDSVREAI